MMDEIGLVALTREEQELQQAPLEQLPFLKKQAQSIDPSHHFGAMLSSKHPVNRHLIGFPRFCEIMGIQDTHPSNTE